MFNFCIATEWFKLDNRLCVYTIHNKQIHYGTDNDANNLLDYVKQKSPDQCWRIIKIE